MSDILKNGILSDFSRLLSSTYRQYRNVCEISMNTPECCNVKPLRSATISIQWTTLMTLKWKIFRKHTSTSNMTSITKVRRASTRLFASIWCSMVNVITTLYYVAIIFIVECGIACFPCAMCVFEVRASSSSRRLPLCQTSFLSWPPLLS